jgi:hypothetical protein
MGRVKLGMPVEIVAEDGSTLRSKITFVSPRLDPTNQLLLVKAAVPSGDPRFRNMQVVPSRVVWRQVDAIQIPVLAVSRQSSAIFAFTVGKKGDQTVAQQKVIKTSNIVGNNYVVQSGLNPGDQVIVTSVNLLADGMPVQPLPPQPQNAPAAAQSAGAPGAGSPTPGGGRPAGQPMTNAQGTR